MDHPISMKLGIIIANCYDQKEESDSFWTKTVKLLLSNGQLTVPCIFNGQKKIFYKSTE